MRILKRYNRKFSAMVALGAVFAPALGQNPIPARKTRSAQLMDKSRR